MSSPIDETTGKASSEINLSITQAITDPSELPKLPEEMIEGVIRRGSKLMIAGASKSGKSFLLIELALAVATGSKWCGIQCTQSHVLYVNLEIQEPQFMSRVFEVVQKMNLDIDMVSKNFHISNLRGKVSNIKSLVDAVLATLDSEAYDLVIIDPTYKVQTGAENSAEAITEFCRELDRLVEEHGCTVAYCHHHSKGNQSSKDAEDRASGSGVFARDADAIIDMQELHQSAEVLQSSFALNHPAAVPFRLEFVLRDFPKREPIEIWFVHPIHLPDTHGDLIGCAMRKPGGNSSKGDSSAEALAKLENQINELMGERNEINRKDFLNEHPMDIDKFKRCINKSELFETESFVNSAIIRRKHTFDSIE